MAGGGRWRSYGSLTAQVANIVPGIGASGVQVLSQVPQPIGEVLVPSRDAISDVPDAFLKFSAVGGYALESGSNVVDESLAVASDDAFAQEIGRKGIQQPQRAQAKITCQAVSENAAAYGSGCSDDVLQSTCFWCICHINITTI